MSEGTVQIPVGRRRIIRRPRLTRLLDDANARLILLVAPAGYGKTTLARQWLAEGRRQHAWYTATAPSSDVSALALGLARVLETVVPGPAERMRQRLLAVPASEEEPELVAEILADSASAWPDEAWLVVDDYHHIGASATADRFFARFAQVSGMRLLLTSRTHPAWASARQTTYGEVVVVDTGGLALTPTESAAVLGVKHDESLAALLEVTQGWPVVTGLAAVTGGSAVPERQQPRRSTTSSPTRSSTAPHPRPACCSVGSRSSRRRPSTSPADSPRATADPLLKEAVRLGLLERDRTALRMHPLLRDFLKSRFREYPVDEREEALEILTEHLQAKHAWDDLFELINRTQPRGRCVDRCGASRACYGRPPWNTCRVVRLRRAPRDRDTVRTASDGRRRALRGKTEAAHPFAHGAAGALGAATSPRCPRMDRRRPECLLP